MIEYKDATDLKQKPAHTSLNVSDLFWIDKGCADLDTFVEGIGKSIKKYILDFLLGCNASATRYSISENIITIHYTRVESESEYYKRKKQEELEYTQHLGHIEKEKHKAKERLQAKFQQYESLRKEFEGKTLEDVLNF